MTFDIWSEHCPRSPNPGIVATGIHENGRADAVFAADLRQGTPQAVGLQVGVIFAFSPRLQRCWF